MTSLQVKRRSKGLFGVTILYNDIPYQSLEVVFIILFPNNIFMPPSYRWILVYIFCLISIYKCFSFWSSYRYNNSEYWTSVTKQLSLKIWALSIFSVIWLWKLKILQRIRAFATQKFCSFWNITSSAKVTRKELKPSLIIYFHTLFTLLNLIRIKYDACYEEEGVGVVGVVARVLAHKPVHFVSLSDSFILVL